MFPARIASILPALYSHDRPSYLLAPSKLVTFLMFRSEYLHLIAYQTGSDVHAPLLVSLGTNEPGLSQMALVVKNLPASAGDIRDAGLIPWLGRSLGGGHGNLLQYSCLENPMDRGAWRATVHGVTNSQTRLKQLSTRAMSQGNCSL